MDSKIELFWYRPHKNKKSWKDFFSKKKHPSLNFGDELSRLIVERMGNKEVVWAKPGKKGKFLALGSILHFAEEGDTIWGTGVNGKLLGFTGKVAGLHLDVKAVRGPLTRTYLQGRGVDCPETYGDPGILTAELFPEFKTEEQTGYIVIPHYSELEWFAKNHPEEQHIVSPVNMPEVVIKEIAAAELVVSSSLHGIIVAESYGVPAVLLKVSDEEPLFKYQDYYEATGRTDFKIAGGIQEALGMGGTVPPIFDKQPLIEAFPY
jgi:pyruvyltransferase